MLRRGVCSAERLLSVVGAEVWAEIRSCCGSCCCAAWLILHWTFFPLLTLLWSLLGADRSRLPAAAAAGTLLSQAAGTGRANKQSGKSLYSSFPPSLWIYWKLPGRD